jgi:cyclophilin family peptidyl-prolyl cis-trans isomerase
MLQLQKIERHATTLHKDVQRRLRKAGLGDSASEPVSLQALSGRLYAHVLDLQRAIQKDARSKIIERYGEGPLKLVLNLQFADEEEGGRGAANSQLEILFWTATPHATWTLLEQVGRHIWDGAVFEWGSQDKVLQVTPVHGDPQQRGRLEFTEFLKEQQHNAWTVGLRDDPETGKLQLFLNLQDNAESHDHETCVGRVISGFDVLQRLILGIRQQADDAAPAAIIRQAIAMHVTTK